MNLIEQKSSEEKLDAPCFTALYQQTRRQLQELNRIVLNWCERFITNFANYHQNEAKQAKCLRTLETHAMYFNCVVNKIKASLETEQSNYAASKINNIKYAACIYKNL